MSRVLSMFESPVTQATAATDSKQLSVQDENRITLAVDNVTDMGGCTLTVEVSYDNGGNWQNLRTNGTTVQLTAAGEQFMFECDGGLLRVNPSGAGPSTDIGNVYLVGDVH